MTTPNAWTILFYLCGDHPTQKEAVETRLQAIFSAGALPNLNLAIQRDRAEGAQRFLLNSNQPDPAANTIDLGAVDTGDPATLLDFMRWGAEASPAPNIALVIAGSGANGVGPLLSFCHDEAGNSALDPLKLDQAIAQFIAETDYRRLNLVLLDTASKPQLELAYQLSGLTDILITPQTENPPQLCNYNQLLQNWQQLAQNQTGPLELARQLAFASTECPLSALNLNRLDDVTRTFDAFCMALLQSLGDSIIWDTVWDAAAGRAFNIAPAENSSFANLQTLLENLKNRFSQTAQTVQSQWYVKKQAGLTPKELEIAQTLAQSADNLEANLAQLPQPLINEYHLMHSQGQRAENLADLARRALDFLGQDGGIVLHPSQNSLSIYNPANLDGLSQSAYLTLSFSRRVHWMALLGAVNLISGHPRALWRLASSLLTTADSAVRENLLRRLVGPDSVMVGFRQQFSALATPAKLTLSLEPGSLSALQATQNPNGAYYRLRLESIETGATVTEQNSLVNTASINSALLELERILKDPWAENASLTYLESLGHSLGEDIVQNLTEILNREYERAGELSGAKPHLQLQLPRSLMRYPWELIHDGIGLLCERYALGRQVFMETGLARQVTRRRAGVIKIMVIGDPLLSDEFLAQAQNQGRQWSQLPGARDEAEQVALTFERLAQQQGKTIDFVYERDVFIHQPFSKLKFRELLRQGDYDIIHYAGHAFFDPQNPEQSAWILSDGPLWAQEIRNTLARINTPPWLVFANACEAGMDAEQPARQYQGDVFGLATAFINQGVTAYIGPLWPINDAVAQQMASDFYYSLLMEYSSLGEALRFAKTEAKAMILGESASATPNTSSEIGLSWASLILYGDPSARVMESLWTPHHLDPVSAPVSPTAETRSARQPRPTRPRRPLQSSAAETRKLVSGPGMESMPAAARSGTPISAGKIEMMMVEVNGLRYWTLTDGASGQSRSLAGSILPQMTHLNEVRQAMGLQRGIKDYIRVVGRWLINHNEQELLQGLISAYDQQVVPQEKFWFITPDAQQLDMPPGNWQWLESNITSQTDRVLLIIHGTFSKTFSPVNGLKGNFLNWAGKYYRGIIGYDHWTLTKTPEENARELWDSLDPRLQNGNKKIDIICHSRGGLVARSLVELLGRDGAINSVNFLCTPNGGTTLADPRNWGYLADMLLNLIHTDSFALFGQLSGFLARLSAIAGNIETLGFKILDQIPGLRAQSPSLTGPTDFLGRLQAGGGPPQGVKYSAIAANYEPFSHELSIANLSKLESLKQSKLEALNQLSERLFSNFNDLIVDTRRVWAIDVLPGQIPEESAPPWLPGERLLVYNPKHLINTPAGAILVDKPGVHHTNVFMQVETQAFLRRQLED